MTGKYFLKFMPKAEDDMAYHAKVGDKSRLKKIARLLEELEKHPLKGTGKPEQLKHELSGRWSRRITDEHRIVYRIDEETTTVVIYQMKDHYE
jgi:toxin YoeB